jgi:hypothetical protein
MLSRPSSRFVDFGEVLKRARPSGNEAKRPSYSAKYRLRVCTHPIRLLQGSSAASRNLARFFYDVLKPSDPASPRPARNVAPKAFTCDAAALFVGHRRSGTFTAIVVSARSFSGNLCHARTASCSV